MTKQLFATENEVRWCAGCGDYAILAAMQRYLAQSGLAPENVVCVSGIGCAGRFPYYINSYGFHTIHGRAPAVATGIKMMRPELSVWLMTGDGDGFSIGLSHLLHCIRRNLNINVLLFNNQVYGLTKGQISPTSPKGQVTKTTPQGAVTNPIHPLEQVLAAGAGFVARGLDKDPKHLAELFKQAEAHQGCSFIEIYQNCPIFNDGAFETYDNKKTRAEHVVYLEQGQALQFGGKEAQQFLTQTAEGRLHVSDDESLALSHETNNRQQAFQLAALPAEGMPLPLGVYYQNSDKAVYAAHSKAVTATLSDL